MRASLGRRTAVHSRRFRSRTMDGRYFMGSCIGTWDTAQLSYRIRQCSGVFLDSESGCLNRNVSGNFVMVVTRPSGRILVLLHLTTVYSWFPLPSSTPPPVETTEAPCDTTEAPHPTTEAAHPTTKAPHPTTEVVTPPFLSCSNIRCAEGFKCVQGECIRIEPCVCRCDDEDNSGSNEDNKSGGDHDKSPESDEDDKSHGPDDEKSNSGESQEGDKSKVPHDP
uniref:TIL domain-containing protein n=1 Tax=Steinernema glaseri TaxID=37863 RepID=A0A1I7YBE6_9BILA